MTPGEDISDDSGEAARGPGPADLTRSRSGDFFFAGVAGFVMLVGVVMLSDLTPLNGLVLGASFLAALTLRWVSLRGAAPARPGISFDEEQQQRYERLRGVLNALPQPVMLLDRADKVEMANPACREVFGQDPLGKPLAALVRAPAALDALKIARTERAPREVEFKLTAPDPRSCLFYAAPLTLAGAAETPSPVAERAIVMIRDRTAQKALEKMRTDFIANASHELRTPLTAMLGFIETLETHAKDDPAARERFLGIMRGQAERMLRLVKDLVSLSAIEVAEAQTPTDTVDLSAVAASVCEVMDSLGAGPSCRCGPMPPVLVTGDKDELTQVVQNLADNAARYGGEGPFTLRTGTGPPPRREGTARTGETAAQTAVRLGISADRIAWLQVEDHGEGIARTALPRLTERFYRIDPERSRSVGGTGLGLAIVKHIVQRHRGGMQIESAEGQGSTFTCFLPPAA